MRSRYLIAALGLAFAAAGVAPSAIAADAPKDSAKLDKKSIDADYKAAREKCKPMSGNAQDVCEAEAKAHRKVAMAELDARDKNTPKARHDLAMAKADAAHDVAKERCDDRKGNDKDVCMKDAKAAHERAKADANAQQKTADVRREATQDKREAEYSAAKERCDSLSGDAKARCVNDAKARFGRS
jgi:hypothetical protein